MLKLEDILKLQQRKFYFKFNEGRLPVYLQIWDITSNVHNYYYNMREFGCIHTFKVKHEFAKTFLKYNLPTLINETLKELKIILIRTVYKVMVKMTCYTDFIIYAYYNTAIHVSKVNYINNNYVGSKSHMPHTRTHARTHTHTHGHTHTHTHTHYT